jgi:hypothetical protein
MNPKNQDADFSLPPATPRECGMGKLPGLSLFASLPKGPRQTGRLLEINSLEAATRCQFAASIQFAGVPGKHSQFAARRGPHAGGSFQRSKIARITSVHARKR